MIIDERYFTYPTTYIAGIETVNADGQPAGIAPKIINDIQAYIARLEPVFLRQLLGAEVAAKVESFPLLLSLLAQPDRGTSVIAKYVYFHYMRDHVTFNTIAGEKVKSGEYSTPASASHRLVGIWNDMVGECLSIVSKVHDVNIQPCMESEIFVRINLFNL